LTKRILLYLSKEEKLKLLQHIQGIDEIIEKRIEEENNDLLLSEGMIPTGGLGFNGNNHVPWSQNAPWDLNYDFDNDGIPDALDNFNGPGGFDDD